MRGGRANTLDLAPDQRDRLTHHPEKTEPAGGAHRTRQLGPRDTAHAREHDRPGTAEQVAHGAMQNLYGAGVEPVATRRNRHAASSFLDRRRTTTDRPRRALRDSETERGEPHIELLTL
ncbi:hypothetical protein BVI1335_120002 [Burkholderia vietnamiensis]|nr:hypothetical protein BVI1335_120002 [Burkholderia vietnamiensis]